jgi:hypothetical protein
LADKDGVIFADTGQQTDFVVQEPQAKSRFFNFRRMWRRVY